jgi:type IV pilus assembly protein PilQ
MQNYLKIKQHSVKNLILLGLFILFRAAWAEIVKPSSATMIVTKPSAQQNVSTGTTKNNTNINASEANATLPIIKTRNSSNTIAMDFQNADVKYVLRAICQFAGYNLVMSDTVQGSVTIKLEDISWDEALQLILQIKNLGLRKNGNILRIAPNAELLEQDKIVLEQNKLGNAKDSIEPLEFVTIKLKYAKAMAVKDMITQKAYNNNPESADSVHGIKMLSSRGSLLVDERSNSLFIKDSATYIQGIKQLLKEIDTPVQQVMIEARIVQADKSLEQELGSRLLALNRGKAIIANNLSSGLDIAQKTIPQQPLITNFANVNPSIATIFSPTSSLLLGLELDAAEINGTSKTLSYPKIITSNYQSANIQQGMKIPYHNSSMNSSSTTTEFVNANLSFTVTPQITQAGTVILEIEVHKDHMIAVTAGVMPPIDTNQINTKVEISDGATLLIGGIFINDNTEGSAAVPWLGSIPYLGWLFKQKSIKLNQKELLIYITPRILHNNY